LITENFGYSIEPNIQLILIAPLPDLSSSLALAIHKSQFKIQIRTRLLNKKKTINPRMPIVTHVELELFIKIYLNKFSQLTSKLSELQKTLLLPGYLSEKCEITGTVSKSRGVGIRFNVANKKSFNFQDTENLIEDEVLPLLYTNGNVFFVLDGRNQVLENVNLISKEFFDKNKDLIEKLTRSSNLIMSRPKKFIEIISGDLKLINCTLAFLKSGKNILDKLDCLWLFSSNQSSNFSKVKAESLATAEYQKLASILANRIPIQTLIGTLAEYKKRIDNKKTTEADMQTFFKNNWTILDIKSRRIFPKFNMGGDLIPDFIIETSDFRYVIVEIESPNVDLYTSDKPPRQARKLREADSQIKSYMSYARNNMLFLRAKLPFLSEEKIKGLIIIGRNDILSSKQKEKLEQDRGYSKDYDIVTYDELFESMRVFLENLGFRYSQI